MPALPANDMFSLRHLSWIALCGAALAFALSGVRLFSSISLAEPLQLITSGGEQNSLFPIWKVINGLDAYTDRFKPPFSLITYNWLFLYGYGAVTGAVLALLDLGDAWVPTIARLITFVGAAGAGTAAYLSFVERMPAGGHDFRRLCLALALLFSFGPLIGFWAFTARSDILALALEVTGVMLFLRFHPRKRLAALAAVVVFAYLAWAFKQTAVVLVGATGLFYIFRREWAMAFGLAGIMIAAWGITFALGSPEYITNLLFRDVPLSYELGRGVRNAVNFAVKTTPVLSGVVVLAIMVLGVKSLRNAAWRDDGMLFAVLGTVLAAVLFLPASTQTGASENYFFSLSFFLSLALVSGLALMSEREVTPPKSFFALSTLGWGTLIIAVLLVFAGVKGRIDVRDQHVQNLAKKECLDRMPRPLFVNNRYLSLPWMTPDNEHYVLSFLYEADRKLNRVFDGDGIGGRIAARHFAAIAVMGDAIPEKLDGAAVAGYHEAPYSCPGMVVLLRD